MIIGEFGDYIELNISNEMKKETNKYFKVNSTASHSNDYERIR